MRQLIVLCISLFFLGCAPDFTAPTRGRGDRQAEAGELRRIFEQCFEDYLKLFPVFATTIGDHRYDDRLDLAISEEHRGRQREVALRYLDELAGVDKSRLNREDRLSYDQFEYGLRLDLEVLKFDQHLLPVRQLSSMPVEFPLMGSGKGVHPFKTPADYDRFLKRVEDFEVWVDTAIANMRRGIEAGLAQPRVVMERTLPQLEAMIVAEAGQSIFYQPIRQPADSFSEADKGRLTRDYTRAIEQRIVPAYKKLHAFIKNEYLPKARATVAMSDLPGGTAWYDQLVRNQTTTDLGPDAIFEKGLEEVKRIRSEMEKMRARSGFEGSLAEYSKRLFANAAPRYASKEDLVKGYEAIRAKVAPLLPKLFGRLPKASFEIRPIEEFRERSAPSQYWSPTPDGSRPGIFYVNAARVRETAVPASEPLFLHEALPGHHFQIALQQEEQSLPRFRRFADYTAFIEGWALYAESLGEELGLYTDSYQRFSRLNSELFRAARLVVDVGLHRKGWSREQAVRYLVENTQASEAGAQLEVDRYIAMPAQALAYKIGQLKISAMRAKAEKTLGSRFDIRAFHDELLKDGAMPLELLKRKMDAWIVAQQRRSP